MYDATPRNSFVVALKDIPELWEISYDPQAAPLYDGLVHDYKMGEAIAKPGFLGVRRTPLDEPLDDFFFDQSYRNVLGATRPKTADGAAFALAQLARATGDRARDLDSDRRELIAGRLEKAGAPAAWAQMVRDVVILSVDDEAAAWGEALPVGLRL